MENLMICLDTSVLIDFYQKKNKKKSFFYQLTDRYDIYAVSVITEYEIYTGSNEIRDEYWDKFFTDFVSLPYDSITNKIAVTINRNLKSTRNQIDVPDLMIAATALKNNLPLATLNVKHFQRITDLQLVADV